MATYTSSRRDYSQYSRCGNSEAALTCAFYITARSGKTSMWLVEGLYAGCSYVSLTWNNTLVMEALKKTDMRVRLKNRHEDQCENELVAGQNIG